MDLNYVRQIWHNLKILIYFEINNPKVTRFFAAQLGLYEREITKETWKEKYQSKNLLLKTAYGLKTNCTVKVKKFRPFPHVK